MRAIILTLLPACLAPLSALAADAAEDRLDRQREAFIAARPAAEAGRWTDVEPFLGILEGYPLVPDLRAAWLRKRLSAATDAETGAFLDRYPDLGFTRGLRLAWARSLAERRQWGSYLVVYEGNYAGKKDTELDCLALRARINTGRSAGVTDAALAIWLHPYSRPSECDPVFAYLLDGGWITDAHRRERIDLALQAGQIQLARYLARPLPPADLARIDRWAKMRANPDRELQRAQQSPTTAADRERLDYGLRRLAALDPEAAQQRWREFAHRADAGRGFPPDQRLALERRIALGLARNFLPGGRDAIDVQAGRDTDPIVAHWRVRLALRDGDWPAVLRAIDALPEDAGGNTSWQYWRSRALEHTSETETAAARFGVLASDRDFYGFLAADRLDLPYAWSDQPIPADDALIEEIAARPEFLRLRELFMTGLYSRGRAEWAVAVNGLPAESRAQAAVLAQRWGWYSNAISTAARSGQGNDLVLRYPLPWRDDFVRLSQIARIDPTLAYGVARSESLFMTDVASTAGAIGLMQLMPGTGKETAAAARIPWRGWHSLTDPQTNITLGTQYLSKMLARFGDNPVLATAAYNAGPHRVERWLPRDGAMPADVWIDSIPFRETRRYVRRVLASDVVFDWRMNGEPRRLSARMPPVLADPD